MGILDLTTSIGTDIAFENLSLTIENADKAPSAVQLYENTEKGYYYMYMGEYQGTPIEWRLVSTDGGASRYTYTTGQADNITGECVFVQNTYIKGMLHTSNSRYKQATDDDSTNNPGITYGNNYMLNNNGEFINYC